MITPINSDETDKPHPLPCDCVMTAAGLSSRMGEWKMMLPYRGGTLLDASLKNALSACQRVILVVGHRGDELLRRYASHEHIEVIENRDYLAGLAGSVQLGVAACQSEHLFITHGDLPCLSRPLFEALWRQRSEQTLLPSYCGEAGHPVLMPRTLAGELARAELTGPVRRWLLSHPHRHVELAWPEILLDVDTPAAYRDLLAREGRAAAAPEDGKSMNIHL
ncbi:molybdenum cofactor cytidylyltransferase [Aeromonas diversa]|nr:molybdenum cofactor cytidylyltransferase [Aeromonas diversa]